MDGLNPENVLEFIGYVNNLKHSSRRGWDQLNVRNHEQIAGHMYSMAMMTFLLGNNSTLDRYKCLQLALVHDLAESIVGDITPHDGVTPDEKHALEEEAMKKITCNLGDVGQLIFNLYKEYESRSSPEAVFVKDLDLFDMIFTAAYYEKRDDTPKKLQQFFDSAEGKIQNHFVINLVKALKANRNRPQ